jgi:tetratricopeptide (TPR) repeat protein
MAENQPKSGGRIVKNLIMLAFIAGAAAFVFIQVQKRRLIERENAAVELQNSGSYQQAVDAYEVLRSDLKSEKDRARLQRRIADCYVAMAEEPALSHAEAMKLYRKAYEYDPEIVENPVILKALNASK